MKQVFKADYYARLFLPCSYSNKRAKMLVTMGMKIHVSRKKKLSVHSQFMCTGPASDLQGKAEKTKPMV